MWCFDICLVCRLKFYPLTIEVWFKETCTHFKMVFFFICVSVSLPVRHFIIFHHHLSTTFSSFCTGIALIMIIIIVIIIMIITSKLHSLSLTSNTKRILIISKSFIPFFVCLFVLFCFISLSSLIVHSLSTSPLVSFQSFSIISFSPFNLSQFFVWGGQNRIPLRKFLFCFSLSWPVQLWNSICVSYWYGCIIHKMYQTWTRLLCMQESQIRRIYSTMINQKLQGFKEEVKLIGEILTQATLEMYHAVSARFLPTPAKIHYLFNLRDISKVHNNT